MDSVAPFHKWKEEPLEITKWKLTCCCCCLVFLPARYIEHILSKLPALHFFHYLFFLLNFYRGTNLAKMRPTVDKIECQKKPTTTKYITKSTRRWRNQREVGGWGGDNLPSWVHICSCWGFLIALPWQLEQCWKALSVQRQGSKLFPPSCI